MEKLVRFSFTEKEMKKILLAHLYDKGEINKDTVLYATRTTESSVWIIKDFEGRKQFILDDPKDHFPDKGIPKGKFVK